MDGARLRLCAALALVAALAACAPAGEAGSVQERETTTTAPVVTTVPATTTTTEPPIEVIASDQSGCGGFEGRTPDVLTWVQDRELRSRQGCLLRFTGDVIRPAWNPAGDKLLVSASDSRAYVVDGKSARLVGDRAAEWLGRGDALMLFPYDGSASVVEEDGRVVPVGLPGPLRNAAIAPDGAWLAGEMTVGDVTGLYRVDLATMDTELISATEQYGIGRVEVTTTGDVVYSEDRGEDTLLTRRHHATGELTTFATGRKNLGAFAVVSQYDETAVAWFAGGGCGGPPTVHATRAGRALDLRGTPVAAAPPTAWLPDGTLLFLDRGESCDYSPGTLWSFKGGRTTKIADNVLDVALR